MCRCNCPRRTIGHDRVSQNRCNVALHEERAACSSRIVAQGHVQQPHVRIVVEAAALIGGRVAAERAIGQRGRAQVVQAAARAR